MAPYDCLFRDQIQLVIWARCSTGGGEYNHVGHKNDVIASIANVWRQWTQQRTHHKQQPTADVGYPTTRPPTLFQQRLATTRVCDSGIVKCCCCVLRHPFVEGIGWGDLSVACRDKTREQRYPCNWFVLL